MTRQERDPQRQNYEIRVRGHLGANMLRAFPAFAARTQGQDTLLTGCPQTRPPCTALWQGSKPWGWSCLSFAACLAEPASCADLTASAVLPNNRP
jgi:hypothetical protein